MAAIGWAKSNRERLVLFGVLALAAIACALGLAAPPSRGPHDGGEHALDLLRVLCTTALAIALLLGPGLIWRALRPGEGPGLAFLPLPGLALMIGVACLVWALAPDVEPRVVCFAVLTPLLGLILAALLRAGPGDLLTPGEHWTLLVVGCVLGLAIGRAIWSAGPEGELYGGTMARTLEVGDRSDPRVPFQVVQLVAHGTKPFSAIGSEYFAPYNFSSRGPLAGLASAPTVFLSGGKPPLQIHAEPWQPFDAQGYMAYRLAMMSFAATAFIALWDLTRRIGGLRAARVALLLAATTPFLVHEVWFTWPKMLAATFVLLAGICVIERRVWSAGALIGVGYLVHPCALLGLVALVPLTLWPIGDARWRQPRVKAFLQLLFGVAIAALAWRLVNGGHYDQSGFLDYFRFAGSDLSPEPIDWLAYRGASLLNTFVPLVLPLAYSHLVSINIVGGTSPAVIHFFFQYWDGLPFGIAIVFWPLLSISLWRALRRWPWPVFASVILPVLAFTVYWGSSHSGMLREGLQAWVLVLFAVVALQQRTAGFPWFRSTPIKAILSLRVVELVVVALVPTLATTHVLVNPSFGITDAVALAAMLGFAACLVALVWSKRLIEPECQEEPETQLEAVGAG